MIARLLVAVGVVAASVGFTVFGMATSFVEHDDDMANIGYILMAAGIVASVVGGLWYRAEERREEARLAGSKSARR